jgi:hypothetical protein
MPGWVLILLVLGPLVVVTAIVRKTGGYAPGWQLRCTTCGHTRDAGEAGIVRIGASSGGKRTLGRCSACDDQLRTPALEKKPAEQP